jgi:hypothetical protein
MKKLFMIPVAALLFSATVYGKGNSNSEANYNFDISVSKLGNYLQLASSQTEEVANICDFFEEQMKQVGNSSEQNRQKRLNTAVYGNLKLMKKALTDEQYKKYVIVLNYTLQNKKIEM